MDEKMTGHRRPRVTVAELNLNLICGLCSGYFVDATTITECLHSFCRKCIVTYLESNKNCPLCDVLVHKTRPHMNLRSDKILQDVVYKVVPGLYKNEMKRRRDFYSNHPADAPAKVGEERGDETAERILYTEDEIFSLALHFCDRGLRDGHTVRMLTLAELAAFSRKSHAVSVRYLQCRAGVTVAVLKKFVRCKYELDDQYQIDIVHSDEILLDEYTLKDIGYIYTWRRMEPLKLKFSMFEYLVKRRRVEGVSQCVKSAAKQEENGTKCVDMDTGTDLQACQKPALCSENGKTGDHSMTLVAEVKERAEQPSDGVSVPAVDGTPTCTNGRCTDVKKNPKCSQQNVVVCSRDGQTADVKPADKSKYTDQKRVLGQEDITEGQESCKRPRISAHGDKSRTVFTPILPAMHQTQSPSTTGVAGKDCPKAFKKPVTGVAESLEVPSAEKKRNRNKRSTKLPAQIGLSTPQTCNRKRKLLPLSSTVVTLTKPQNAVVDSGSVIIVYDQSQGCTNGLGQINNVSTLPAVAADYASKPGPQTSAPLIKASLPSSALQAVGATSVSAVPANHPNTKLVAVQAPSSSNTSSTNTAPLVACSSSVSGCSPSAPLAGGSRSSSSSSSSSRQSPQATVPTTQGCQLFSVPVSMNSSVPSAAAAAAGAASPSPAALAASSSPSPPMASSAAGVREVSVSSSQKRDNSPGTAPLGVAVVTPSSKKCNNNITVAAVPNSSSPRPVTAVSCGSGVSVTTVMSSSYSRPTITPSSVSIPRLPMNQSSANVACAVAKSRKAHPVASSNRAPTVGDPDASSSLASDKITATPATVTPVTTVSSSSKSDVTAGAGQCKVSPCQSAVRKEPAQTVLQGKCIEVNNGASVSVTNTTTNKADTANSSPANSGAGTKMTVGGAMGASTAQAALASRNGMPTVVTKPTRVNNAATSVNTLTPKLPAPPIQQVVVPITTTTTTSAATDSASGKGVATTPKADSDPKQAASCRPKPASSVAETMPTPGACQSSGSPVTAGTKKTDSSSSNLKQRTMSNATDTERASPKMPVKSKKSGGFVTAKSPGAASQASSNKTVGPVTPLSLIASAQPGTTAAIPISIQPVSTVSGTGGGRSATGRASGVVSSKTRRTNQINALVQQAQHAKEQQMQQLIEIQRFQEQQRFLNFAIAASFNPMLLNASRFGLPSLVPSSQLLAPAMMPETVVQRQAVDVVGKKSQQQQQQSTTTNRRVSETSPKKKISDIAQTLREKVHQTQQQSGGSGSKVGSPSAADKQPPHAHSASTLASPQPPPLTAPVQTVASSTKPETTQSPSSSTAKAEDEPLNLVMTRNENANHAKKIVTQTASIPPSTVKSSSSSPVKAAGKSP